MQMGLEKFVRLASRTGRELQRYDEFGLGRRQVVGCIPYRYLNAKQSSSSSSSIHGILEEVEVLLITSQKSQTMMFPKGGWESDETIEEAVKREGEEEAGVTGAVQCMLGTWCFKSKSREAFRDGYMFSLLVEEQLDHWPEKNTRQRRWVRIAEARELCPYLWMKEALDRLVQRLARPPSQQETGSKSQRGNSVESECDSACYLSLTAEASCKCCCCRSDTRGVETQIQVPQHC